MPDLPELTRAEIVTIHPGDTIVFTHPGVLSRQAIDDIRRHLEEWRPPGAKVLVLEEGARLTVMRPEGWQPIETAPREKGREILLWVPWASVLPGRPIGQVIVGWWWSGSPPG